MKFLNKKNILIIFAVIIILFSFLGIKRSVEIRKAHQGEMMFYVVDNKDIKDENIKKWYLKNYQDKGIHIYDSNEGKYILLSSGQQDVKNIEIKMESVVGYKNKIQVNGRVEMPKVNVEQGISYPHILLRIEKDSREVVLGKLNLYNPTEIKPEVISIDAAIIKEIKEKGDIISVVTFKNNYKSKVYSLTKDAIKELKEYNLKQGDIVGVQINSNTKNPYNIIENIREAQNTVENVKVVKINEKNKTIEVFINEEIFKYPYEAEIDSKIRNIKVESLQMLAFSKKEGITYIKDVI